MKPNDDDGIDGEIPKPNACLYVCVCVNVNFE